jgi:cyclophilin family peptidyl-prolyl cis-trans isomerase
MSTDVTTPSRSRAPLLAALVLLLGAFPAARPAIAADVVVTAARADDLVLDGKPAEAAWAKAATIPAEPLAGKPLVVKVLTGKGSLWVAVEVAEDPGFPIGLRVMAAPHGTATAADAVMLSFGPLDPRAPRFIARGPKGAGRNLYRFDAAADLSRLDAWTAEARIPLADLGIAGEGAAVALAVAAAGRTPNVLAAAPVGALFQGPSRFARVDAPEGGWRAGEDPGVDPAVLLAADAQDATRMAAFSEYVKARSGAGSAEFAREKLLPPLARALAARPDLVTLKWVRVEVLGKLGQEAAAVADLEAVIAAVPGFREARFELDELLVERWTVPPGTEPSDYDAAFAKIRAEGEKLGPRSVASRIAEAILRYRHGDFAQANALFEPLLASYPLHVETRDKAKRSATYEEAWGQELAFRKADDAKGDLPRVRLATTKGNVVLELFEDDAPNSVRNFVYLARSGFYEGTYFHRVLPFFMAQGGGAKTPAGLPPPGGGPGYAIKTEPSRRKPFRGVVAFARTAQPDTEGSQFFVTTGTAGHLEGEYSVFGRVIEGQDVVDRIVQGDVLTKVEVLRVREGRAYHPKTVGGTPGPEPKKPK